MDLLALNHDEAIEFSGGSQQGANEDQLRTACSEVATSMNPSMNLVVTDGARGAYIFARGHWSSHKAIPMEAMSTAGAGDALLAGTIAGLVAGMPLADREDLHDRRREVDWLRHRFRTCTGRIQRHIAAYNSS